MRFMCFIGIALAIPLMSFYFSCGRQDILEDQRNDSFTENVAEVAKAEQS